MRFFIDQWASLSNILYMRPMRLLVNLKNNKKEWRADKACGPGLEDCRIRQGVRSGVGGLPDIRPDSRSFYQVLYLSRRD